jgi:predicted Zn-dependent protease
MQAVALLATAWTVPVSAKPGAQQQQLKPVLRAIDPSQAQEAPIEETQPAAPPINPGLEQMIPEFGKPNPTVPPSMAAPMPPGPGFASGYAPAQPVPVETMQAPQAPDDPRLARLEQAAFGSSYPEHDTDDRIEHLEREAFSKVFEGDTESRLQRLMAKYNPPGAFGGAPPGRIPAYQPVTAQTQYRPQPPQYQPSAYQPQPPMYGQPPQQFDPRRGGGPAPPAAQQPMYQQPTAYAPPSLPAYQPAQQGYMPPQQQQPYQQPQGYQPPPPSIPSQPYRPPQAAWQQPQQQPPQYPTAQAPYPPGAMAPLSAVPQEMGSAPPSIPQGPVTMGSFNRQPPQTASLPPQQQQRNPYSQPGVGTVPPASTAGSSNMRAALDNMPYDTKAGDYSQQILRQGGSFARWTNLPVRVHVPLNTPENWRAPLDSAVKRWAQYLPVTIAPTSEPADIEVGWINHLMPRQLGITNLEIFNGHPRVTVYLLRPSYYPPDVPESTLQRVALHEFGHALGLWGHSSTPGDAMFELDKLTKTPLPKTPIVSQRDINTLRRVYEAPPLPEGFQSAQPISWP